MATISFSADTPKSGFFYVLVNDEGEPELIDPPEDWSDGINLEGPYENIRLACSVSELFHSRHKDGPDGHGEVISKPDLYLKFANTHFTPSSLLEFANTCGLLNLEGRDNLFVKCSEHQDIASGIPKRFWDKAEKDDWLAEEYGVDFPPGDYGVVLATEEVGSWFSTQNLLRALMDRWSIYEKDDVKGKSRFFKKFFNSAVVKRSLTYVINFDPIEGVPCSELLATGLENALMIQWGMDLTSGAEHKQCGECDSWIVVVPGKGRPEKTYCSTACSMRAYRKRKKVKKHNG